jgi:enoyl-CoA hydratase/carnithine racemase
VFTGQTHQDFPAALEEISLDRENKALVVTGTGDSFVDQIDGPSLGEIFKPAAWEKTRVEGAKVLQRLLEAADPDVPFGMALEGLAAARPHLPRPGRLTDSVR